jgi:glutamate synthase domain-containing protein 2
MSASSIDLGKLSRLATIGMWAGLLACTAGAIVLTPWLYFGVAVFGAITLADFYYRFIQKSHSILRNFGLFGRARYVMESIGPELRQYWIASDTEERPFNRRQRAEVYRYAKNEKVKSAPFGTLQDLKDGTIRHSLFPVGSENLTPYSLVFGEERDCPQSYTISKPFMISAMSFGSLGEHAVRALARGARVAGIPINTGEGGYPKYHLMEGPDVIFQMGTAKFGCRNVDGSLNDDKLAELASHPQVKMVEIKFSQGAKPGKGGLLPGAKVTPEIAELRGVEVGKDVVSPPGHLECDTLENTVRFIRRVQDVAGLPVGIKMCLGSEIECRGLLSEMRSQDVFPDYIVIDGAEGGTGAAPLSFLDHVGMPMFPALRFMHASLTQMGVRNRTKLVAAGKLINPGLQIKAFAAGVDAVYSARGYMFAIGCIQALDCNSDRCPVGITTHDRTLQRGLDIESKAVRVASYVQNLEHVLFELLGATGCRSLHELTDDNIFRLRPTLSQQSFGDTTRRTR